MFRLLFKLVIALLIAVPMVAQAEDNVADLKGTWVADMTAIRTQSPKEYGPQPLAMCQPGPCSIQVKYVIQMQEGSVFAGMKYGPTMNQTVVGVIDPDNKSVHMVDQKGFIFGKLVDPNKIHLTFLENTQHGQVAAQGFLVRQDR
jgi:hypothetical protein